MEGRICVVTGCARAAGIGRAICEMFLKVGASVVGLDVASMEVPLEAAKFRFAKASVCDSVAVHDALSAALTDLGQGLHVHVLVNNAGIAQPEMKSGDTLSRLLEFEKYVSTNLTSAFVLSEVCSKWFPERGVSIVHVASTRAHQSEPSCEGYASAKAGLIGLTHAQGQTLAGKARVNVILPGWINTDPSYFPSDADHAWHAGQGRVGLPDDVAQMALFLADESKSGFITCSEFVVDGGVSRKMVYPE